MKTIKEYIEVEQVVEALKLGVGNRKYAAQKTHLDKPVNSIEDLAEMCQNYLSSAFVHYKVSTSKITEKSKILYSMGSSVRSNYNTGYICKKHFTVKFTEPSKKLSTMEITVGEHKDMFLFAYRFRKSNEKLESAPVNAGKYTVKVILEETNNYTSAVAESVFEITKATYDMSGIKFENVTVTYDGLEHKIEITEKNIRLL